MSELEHSKDPLAARFEPDVIEHQVEGLGRRIILLAIWTFLFCQVAQTAIGGHSLSVLGALGLLLFLAVRVWCVDVTPRGLRLWRILDRRVIPWQEIDEISYSGVSDEVAEISHNGRFLRIPSCVDQKKLTEAIERNITGQAERACHVDFHSPKYAGLFVPALTPKERRNWSIALPCGFVALGIAVGWSTTTAAFLVVIAILAPVALIYQSLKSMNRAYKVRLTERGLGISTWRGHFEFKWTDIESAIYAQQDACLRLKTARQSFTLGHELTNFQDLLRAIEERSAPRLGATRSE